MKKIRFSYNWNNKLNCKAFTTIRLYSDTKYNKGEEYTIELNEQTMLKTATIVDIELLRINDICERIALLDTGYSAEETKKILKKMYKAVNWETQRLMLILCKYTDNNTLVQHKLF